MGYIYDERGRRIGHLYGGGFMKWIGGLVTISLLLWWLFTGENPFKNGGTMELRAKQARVSISKVSKEEHHRIKDLMTFKVTYYNTNGKIGSFTKKFAQLNVSSDSLDKLGKLGVNIVSFHSSTKEITELQHAFEQDDPTPLVRYKRAESPDDVGHEYFNYYGIEMKDNILVMPQIVKEAKSK